MTQLFGWRRHRRLSAPQVSVWYEITHRCDTMRQASRRSWRIGQSESVQVVFMSYRHTPQADDLKLVAQKL
ncbi:MAG: hypothetical protein OXH38_04710 [Chloroflexi bacterium]|nr:hypothetical protein [Chloroflexota bacterium]